MANKIKAWFEYIRFYGVNPGGHIGQYISIAAREATKERLQEEGYVLPLVNFLLPNYWSRRKQIFNKIRTQVVHELNVLDLEGMVSRTPTGFVTQGNDAEEAMEKGKRIQDKIQDVLSRYARIRLDVCCTNFSQS